MIADVPIHADHVLLGLELGQGIGLELACLVHAKGRCSLCLLVRGSEGGRASQHQWGGQSEEGIQTSRCAGATMSLPKGHVSVAMCRHALDPKPNPNPNPNPSVCRSST